MLCRISCNVNKISRKLYSSVAEVPKISSEHVLPMTDSEAEKKPKCLLDEIVEQSIEKNRERTWADELKDIQTVEEKLIKINMPKYYGYKVLKLEDSITRYNSLGMIKHYTNTHFEEVKSLPDYYKKYLVDDISKKIASQVIDSIEFASEYSRFQGSKSNKHSLDALIVQQINSCLLKSLSGDFKHLHELEIDINPRHEAFWWTGGIQPTVRTRKALDGLKHTKDRVNNPTLRAIQYVGTPLLALRHNLQLEPFGEVSGHKNISELIPLFEYDARTLGYTCEYRHASIIPGYWPANVNEFGFLNYQHRTNSIERNRLIPATADILNEAMQIKAIQSSFAWLYAQACYQGFSNFEDVTYPFTTQTIVTDGKQFSFFGYQLNTTLARHNNKEDNTKFNTCWGTKETSLYEAIDDKGKCVGFNEEVLKNLISFYVNQPTIKRSKHIQRVSDIKNDEKREFLHNTHKHLMSNRPRNRLTPEIYLWEKIYKIDNKTRPLEARKRFFELGIDPFSRKLDHHKPVYIPRDLRPDGYKSKKRWTKTYYP